MATNKKSPAGAKAKANGDGGVDAFLGALDHPLKSDIVAARAVILGAAPEISEAIKWNAPSFRTTDFFATFHLRSRDEVQLVFHMGAKVKATAASGVTVDDPTGLLKWLAKDRAMVSLGAGKVAAAKHEALAALVRAWITWL